MITMVVHPSDGLKRTEQIPANIPPLALETLLVDLLDQKGGLQHLLVGESMHPTLPSGSLLIVKPLTGEPAAGDVLVFVWADQLVAHRLIVNHRQRMITQGDNCALPDPILPPDHIIGQVCSATHGDRVIWSLDDHPYWRWRWIIRAYILAAKRRVRRLIQRRRS